MSAGSGPRTMKRGKGFVTFACTFLITVSPSRTSDFISLFHHHHVGFHKQHLGCRPTHQAEAAPCPAPRSLSKTRREVRVQQTAIPSALRSCRNIRTHTHCSLWDQLNFLVPTEEQTIIAVPVPGLFLRPASHRSTGWEKKACKEKKDILLNV